MKNKLANFFHLIFQTTVNCKQLMGTMKNESKKKENACATNVKIK